ncbi:MAG TPA: DUF2784 domain-containing protein [Gammaproteobacteria bacterium]|nr:DUF2784 domain-containing protein [Gammaproteobacteria bacterium]
MGFALLADGLVAVHALFVVAAVAGGLLVLRWPSLAAVHLPVLLWAAAVELAGWPCPLTPLEQALRRAAGEQGYAGGFLDHYLWPLLYPPGLTRSHQVALGAGLLAFNAVVYTVLWRRLGRRRRQP